MTYFTPGDALHPAARLGWRYRSVTVLARGASVSSPALPGRRIQAADLLI